MIARAGQPAGRRDSERGITIAELLIVMTVLGIMIAFAIPRIDLGIRRARVGGAVTELSAAHFLARTTAVRYGRPAELHIDAANARFWVQADTSIAGGGTVDTVGFVHRVSDGGVTMTSTRSVLCFDRRGFAYEGGSCEAANLTATFSLAGRTDSLRTTVLGKIIR